MFGKNKKKLFNKTYAKRAGLLILLVFIVIGFTLPGVQFGDPQTYAHLDYNDFSFTPLATGGFVTTIQGVQHTFSTHPTAVQHIEFPPTTLELIQNNPSVTLSWNTSSTHSLSSATLILSRTLQQQGIVTYTNTLALSCDKYASSEGVVILFTQAEQDTISLQDNCLLIQFALPSFAISSVEHLRYSLLGVIE